MLLLSWKGGVAVKAVSAAFLDRTVARGDLEIRTVQQRALEDFGGFEWESKASSVAAVHGWPQGRRVRQAR